MKTSYNMIVHKIFILLSKKQKIYFFVFVCAMIIGATMEICAVGIMLPLMNVIVGGNMTQAGKFQEIIYGIFQCDTNDDLIFSITIMLVMIYAIKGIYKYILLILKAKYIWDIRNSLSVDAFSRVMNVPYSYHLHNDTAKMQNILITDIERIVLAFNSVMELFLEIFTGLGLLVFLIFIDSSMAFAMLLLFGSIFFLNKFLLAEKIRSTGIVYTKSVAAMLRCVQQSIGGIKFIYATHRQSYVVEQYVVHADMASRCAERFTLFSNIPTILVENASMAGICVIMAVLVTSGGKATLLLPVAATFALAAVRLLPVCNRVMAALNLITYRHTSVETVYRLLSENRVKCDTTPREAPSPVADDSLSFREQTPLTDGISMNNLSFRFEVEANPFFQNISLNIPANKTTALIGPSGAGKTTLADIILGLHEPYEGTVLADGRDIFKEKDWWSAKVGYIPQNVYLYDDTICNNVAFGLAPGEVDESRVRACLKDASLWEFVESLPHGLDTVIGENGIRLSGGQRQRLGIARALYTRPVFIVMDEATSALDNTTEEAVMETIAGLSGKVTLLIIAHRLSTIENSDCVYRITEGRVILERSPYADA